MGSPETEAQGPTEVLAVIAAMGECQAEEEGTGTEAVTVGAATVGRTAGEKTAATEASSVAMVVVVMLALDQWQLQRQ